MKRNPKKENAHRLAYAIRMNADDATVKTLAKLLIYNEEQLRKDINDLAEYISDLEQQTDKSADYDLDMEEYEEEMEL